MEVPSNVPVKTTSLELPLDGNVDREAEFLAADPAAEYAAGAVVASDAAAKRAVGPAC